MNKLKNETKNTKLADNVLIDDKKLLITIGDKFKEARIAKGFTQAEVSAAVGLKHINSLHYIEQGMKKNVSVTLAKRICDFLGMDIKKLF